MSNRKKRVFCLVCGHAPRGGKCDYCDAKQSEHRFLEQIPHVPVVTLRCPYVVKDNDRCQGRLRFPADAFRQTIGAAGNGPGTYELACRHNLQARCSVCGHWCGACDLIRNNIATLKRFAARQVGKRSKRK
ncbi:MAG: hypothetical protein IMZ62_12855 [Chloroflexi bacterium]|nr:hypothetical protein [Chloroflexota bacterium]MBE3119093.1 hypothetical protein [Candidatus Atribacteria bacterium]